MMKLFQNILRSKLSNALLLAILTAATGASAQTPSPTPFTIDRTPGTRKQPSTVEDLTSAIKQKLASPQFRRGQIGIKVASLKSGKVLIEENAEKYFMPASNMKNFTVATAIERLSPDYRYVTSVYSNAKPDENGLISGPVVIAGRGDVSFSYSFNEGDNFKAIDRIVDQFVSAGIKQIDGDIVGDATYFRGSALPNGWEWDDLQFYYGAEVSALSVNDNVIGMSVRTSTVGSPCSVTLTPPFLVMRVKNTCITTAAGTPRTLRIHKPVGQNIVEISGGLPSGNSGFSGYVSVTDPAEMFAALLKQRLESKGIIVKGRGISIHEKANVPTASHEIARVESPPLALIAAKTMKPSQNMYTETLLWTLGEDQRKKLALQTPIIKTLDQKTSAELGIESVREFLKSIGVAEDAVLQADGSGLSRHNLITPSSVVQLYTYMANRSKFSQAWRDSLTIGAVDGTLQNRFKGTRGAANVRGKTGTINQVSALSGYVTTVGGDQLVFSLLVNGVSQTGTRVALIDDIVVMLADFNGKID